MGSHLNMEEGLNSRIDRLQQLNLRWRQQLEVAETYIPPLNELLARLAPLDLMNGLLVLGDGTCYRAYNPEADRDDSALVYQAAAYVPDGIGVVVWDQDEYLEAARAPTGMEEQSRSKFLNFDLCSNGLQALLVEQVPGLLEKLFGRIFLRLPFSARNVSS